MRKLGMIAVIGLLALTLSGCAVWRTSVVSFEYETGTDLKYDFSLYPTIEAGQPTVCHERPSEVAGRGHLCRVIDGHEESGDYRNYVIDCDVPPADPGCVQAAGGDFQDRLHGGTIVMQDGTVYEGCYQYTPTNDYACDYRARKHVVLNVDGGGWSFALLKAWAWFQYGGDAIGCAGGLAAIWAGVGYVTWPFLAACVDGPL